MIKPLMHKILHDLIYLNSGNMVLYHTWVMQSIAEAGPCGVGSVLGVWTQRLSVFPIGASDLRVNGDYWWSCDVLVPLSRPLFCFSCPLPTVSSIKTYLCMFLSMSVRT